MADSKISQLTPITGANILDSDEFIVARAGTFENFAVTRAEMFLDTPAITTSDLTATTADINGGTVDGTAIGGTTAAAGTFTNLTATTALTGTLATAAQPNITSVGTLTSATITGDLTVDTNTLYVDSANNRVGIGTSSPAEMLDVTGTVTADGLTVDGSATLTGNISPASDEVLLNLASLNGLGAAGNMLRFTDNDPTAINNGSIGKIQFYSEDTDAVVVEIEGQNANASPDGRLIFKTAEGTTLLSRMQIGNNGDISFYEDTGTTPKFFWDASAEHLGIGTSSPNQPLEVRAGVSLVRCVADANNISGIDFGDTTDNDAGRVRYLNDVSSLQFSTAGSEAMRIDSSGNVLVGTTDAFPASNSDTTAGIALRSDGQIVNQTLDSTAIIASRENGGEIIQLRDNGINAGSIGCEGPVSYIVLGPVGLRGNTSTNSLLPADSTGGASDNSVDLGRFDFRFDDIYATNGTIQTSDRSEKQDIEELTEAEQRVAVACKGLMRKFRWKSAVAEKGDDARIHFGIIAQDLQEAFAAEGLDAGRYAMFIHSKWTDEKTGEQRSRMGVRYSELLAFIIAAI